MKRMKKEKPSKLRNRKAGGAQVFRFFEFEENGSKRNGSA